MVCFGQGSSLWVCFRTFVIRYSWWMNIILLIYVKNSILSDESIKSGHISAIYYVLLATSEQKLV